MVPNNASYGHSFSMSNPTKMSPNIINSSSATSTVNPEFESLDWDFFYSALQSMTGEAASDAVLQNALNLDTDLSFDPLVSAFPGIVEAFSPPAISDEATLDWNFDGFSLARLDPFEHHRLQIINYLQNSGHSTPCEIAYLSSRNAKVFFHAFFRRFQPHSPFIHLPTFNVAEISTSLFFAIFLLGAIHRGEADNDSICKSLWHTANAFVWEQAKVLFPDEELMEGRRTWQ